ncbi:hypothetical protein BB777_05845 [Planococcus faecalis]|nr:hypothetical protein BB777_05845 [Planococcus faecalis]
MPKGVYAQFAVISGGDATEFFCPVGMSGMDSGHSLKQTFQLENLRGFMRVLMINRSSPLCEITLNIARMSVLCKWNLKLMEVLSGLDEILSKFVRILSEFHQILSKFEKYCPTPKNTSEKPVPTENVTLITVEMRVNINEINRFSRKAIRRT